MCPLRQRLICAIIFVKILKCAPSNMIRLQSQMCPLKILECAPLKQWIWIKCAPWKQNEINLCDSALCPLITWNGKDLKTCVKCLLNVQCAWKNSTVYIWFTHFCREFHLFAITRFLGGTFGQDLVGGGTRFPSFTHQSVPRSKCTHVPRGPSNHFV